MTPRDRISNALRCADSADVFEYRYSDVSAEYIESVFVPEPSDDPFSLPQIPEEEE